LSPVLDPDIEDVPVTANVGVVEPDNVIPLTEVGVIAPKDKVIAGVVVAVATVPDIPLAVVTETEDTVPVAPAAAAILHCPAVFVIVILEPATIFKVLAADPLYVYKSVPSVVPVSAFKIRELVTLPAEPVVFWFNVGMSAATIVLKVGTPASPVGAARKVFAVCELKFEAVTASVPLNVMLPVVVTVPEILKPDTVPVPDTDVTVPVLLVYPEGLLAR
jgi:hypothetical protein